MWVSLLPSSAGGGSEGVGAISGEPRSSFGYFEQEERRGQYYKTFCAVTSAKVD